MRVGIIGSGFGLYGLLPAFNSIKGCEVVAICGKKTERLVTYCSTIGLTKIYSSWEKMLDEEKLDAVAIAVVPSAQYEIAKKAIKKGLHIFAEKPLTANYTQAKELLALATKKKVTTIVDFIFPEIDEWQKAKQLLDSGAYGDIKHIGVTWNFLSYDIKNKISSWKTNPKEGGGALSFYGSHVLYYLGYFGGEIAKNASVFTYSDVSKNGGEVGVDSVITFKSGATGNLHLSCNTVGVTNHTIIFQCEKATLVLESAKGVTEHFTLSVHTQDKHKIIPYKKDKKKGDEDERVRVVKKLVTRFIVGCKSKTQVVPSFKEGVKVQKLISTIQKSSI